MALTTAFLLAACDSPSGGLDRARNAADPISDNFVPEKTNDLQLTIQPNGHVVLNWDSDSDGIQSFIIEKSLRDTTDFRPFGEIAFPATEFVDSTGVVTANTNYRVLSNLSPIEDEPIILESKAAELVLQIPESIEYQFNEPDHSLLISWDVGHPFIAFYEISSNKILQGTNTKVIDFPSGEPSASFVDELSDISFAKREYILKGFLNVQGNEELLFEKSVTFDPAIFFRPTIDLDILSEKRWAFTFQNVPFFAEKITVFRVGGYQQRDVEFELSPTETSFVDSLILGSVESNNQFREYNVTVSDEFNAGIATNFRRFFKISHPRLSIQNPTSIVDEVTFQISPSTNPESQNDLIEEYVIERSDLITGSTRFRAIGRVKPNESGEATFTDILSSPSRKRYLVRTATSGPSNLITLELDNSLDIQVHGAGDKPVYHIESTPDNGFLAFILTVENTSYNALMAINNNTFFASSVSSSQDLTVRSFSLSGTGNTVYIALEERNSVLRTGFPNNSSPLEIIKPDPDDYVLSSIAVSPDESFLFATDPSGSVKRWNLLNFQEDFHVDPAQPATNTRTNIAVSPNGAYVVVGGAQTTVLDADTGALLTTLSGICTGNFTFNDASTYFSCFNENTNQPLLFNTSNWQQHSFQNLTMQAGTFQAHTIHPTRPESILFTDTNRILFHDYEKNETINILDPMNLFRDNNATTIHWLSDDRITIGTDSGLVFNIVVLENRWRRVIN